MGEVHWSLQHQHHTTWDASPGEEDKEEEEEEEEENEMEKVGSANQQKERREEYMHKTNLKNDISPSLPAQYSSILHVIVVWVLLSYQVETTILTVWPITLCNPDNAITLWCDWRTKLD